MADNLSNRQLSRRELVRMAGIGGLTAALSTVGPMPLSALAAPGQPDTPEALLASIFAKRATAMSAGDTGVLDDHYDPANAPMLAYEKERARFYFNGLGARWGNRPVLGYESNPQLIELKMSGTVATARLYEQVKMTWIPPQPLGQQTVRRGPRGEISTFIGNRHELTLTKGTSGWSVSKHAYDEYGIYLPSPDLTPGSWAEIQKGGPSGIPDPGTPAGGAQQEPQVSVMAIYYYNRSLALTHAHNTCNPLAGKPYSSQYCNYVPCGGDCANFVSQCLRAGGHPESTYNFYSTVDNQYHGYWKTNNWGSCGQCGTSAQYAGTDTWANNEYLRDFLNTSGRAQPVASLSQLMYGDVINYAWPGSCSYWTAPNDNRVDHIVIVSERTQDGGALICSHDRDLCDGWWDLYSSCGVKFRTYTHLYDSFSQ
jgi:hypothetical protein